LLSYDFIFYSFFFYSLGYHRDLHSFPTRRSSDLFAYARSDGKKIRAGRGARPYLFEKTSGFFQAECRIGAATIVLGVSANQERRSEEHTSELQSRENLVCRLLLEKKKKSNRKKSR